ncbi:FERM and PDZ domain containing protein 1 [Dissostichus eleginoides]|uniref:FERM and PDZ domain containing protein 1 n=1 Tax=Dissostichus eleginoides TaxID=100907 RepID=A0AAD9C5N3_DISEL|nr:FERM and PDZ domain containing protein 1 [Dissostichus eleginoides]
MFFIIIFTMIEIYVYSCFLSALSFVEMKSLNTRGCVGERVTFTCSDWNTVFGVNLKVTDAASYCPKRTPDTVDTFTTLSSAVSNISTLSSNNKHNITDVSASNTTLNTPTHSAPATQAAVMVVLLLTRKLMKRGQRGLDASSPHEDIYNSARPDEVYQSLHPLTMDEDQVYSSLTEGSALHTTLDHHCSRK